MRTVDRSLVAHSPVNLSAELSGRLITDFSNAI